MIRSLTAAVFLAALVLQLIPGRAAPPVRTNLFSTGFEYLEGFDTRYLLDDQNGWVHLPIYQSQVKIDLPADGVITNQFAGLGQQAWVGGEFVFESVDQVHVWHPTIIDPIPAATPVIRFKVLMAIEDSTFQQYDFFRWSVYNSRTNRLFSIDFDNADFTVAYQLDDDQFYPVNRLFTANVAEELEIAMNFSANQWSAWLGGDQIVTNAPISTTGARASVGQIRALWLPSDPETPGDNRMVFDNFQVSAESLPTVPIPPLLSTLGRTTNGYYALRLVGEPDCRYVIDFSTDSTLWSPLKTNIAVDGSFDYVDTNAPVTPQRFFRARQLPAP